MVGTNVGGYGTGFTNTYLTFMGGSLTADEKVAFKGGRWEAHDTSVKSKELWLDTTSVDMKNTTVTSSYVELSNSNLALANGESRLEQAKIKDGSSLTIKGGEHRGNKIWADNSQVVINDAPIFWDALLAQNGAFLQGIRMILEGTGWGFDNADGIFEDSTFNVKELHFVAPPTVQRRLRTVRCKVLGRVFITPFGAWEHDGDCEISSMERTAISTQDAINIIHDPAMRKVKDLVVRSNHTMNLGGKWLHHPNIILVGPVSDLPSYAAGNLTIINTK